MLLKTNNLKKHFATNSGTLSKILGREVVHAVDGVSLQVEEGETLGLVGESGCGKSTLGRTLIRLHEPTSGQVIFNGTDITSMSQRELRPYRKDMQMVFQNPQSSLNPRQTVKQILQKPIEFHGIASGEEAENLIIQTLEDVGLSQQHLNRNPHEFSGGQQQRIGIARALVMNPSFIVLDEPVSALDVSIQAQVLKLINGLKSKYDLTLIFIAHDLNVIRYICDTVAVMYLGKVVEHASTDELFRDPHHPYTNALLNSIALPDPDVTLDYSQTVQGTIPSPIDPPTGCNFHTRCPEVMDKCKEVSPELRPRSKDESNLERITSCHLYD